MFESAELGHVIDKETFKNEVPKLRAALLDHADATDGQLEPHGLHHEAGDARQLAAHLDGVGAPRATLALRQEVAAGAGELRRARASHRSGRAP